MDEIEELKQTAVPVAKDDTNDGLARLYPALSQEKLQEAKENLDQYLSLAWEIWEAEQSTLTVDETGPRIKIKVDSPN
jgi:hypothetical protein